MTRTVQDHDFLVWEVFTSSGRFGSSDHGQIVFHCLTDRDRRPRHAPFDGTDADAQKWLLGAADAELGDLLEAAPVLA